MTETESSLRERPFGGHLLGTGKSRLDLSVIHGFLCGAYWCRDIPLSIVRKSVEHSQCFGVHAGAAQVGFARAITDRATFAYLGDVFILEAHRGRGLSKALMEFVMGDPALQGLRRFLLATRDAHGLYRRSGYRPLANPEWFMERIQPDVYAQS